MVLQLWRCVWSRVPNWEEKLKKYSPSKPEKCHAGLINQLLTECQLRTRQWRQTGGRQELILPVKELRI